MVKNTPSGMYSSIVENCCKRDKIAMGKLLRGCSMAFHCIEISSFHYWPTESHTRAISCGIENDLSGQKKQKFA